jgi:hypothetical protein
VFHATWQVDESQPAAIKAVSRLRKHFDKEPRKYEPADLNKIADRITLLTVKLYRFIDEAFAV